MANIKKSFNFRNGVQVDEDNLLVTPTGLVAIGKTIPTEALDVIGNVVISGVTSSVFSQTGILTVTTLEPTEIIGAGVSVVSGVVTSNSGSGIVTYYGDARFLQGMPTSQWEDTDVGFGVSSIYNTGGTVGIATTNPQFTLQVGGNPNDELPGVGIASAGNINAHGNITSKSINVGNNIQLGNAGIITAASFIGSNLTGNVTGNLTGNVSSDTVVSGIATFSKDLDVDGHTNLDNVSISGVTTFTGATTHSGGATVNTHLDVIGLTTLDDVNVSSGATFAGTIDANGNLDVAGVSTFSDDVVIGVGATVGIGTTVFFGDDVKLKFGDTDGLEIYHSQNLEGTNDSYIDSSARNLYIRLNTETDNGGNIALQAKKDEHGVLIHDDGAVDLYFDGVKKLETSLNGVTVSPQLDAINIVASGVITATTELNSPLIGVGTDAPANDIQVRKSGNAEIQVTSDTGTAGLTLGREPDTNNTNNAEFRYGSASGGAPYSSAQSLDIINYGTDNFNYHLSANNPGGVVGDFHWHKGLNSGRLMTLTNTGRLGIGETQPNETLHIAGVSSVTGNSFVGGNFSVSGNSTVGGSLTVDGPFNISSINTDITGNVTGNLTGNVNSTSGISTFLNVGINTTLPLPTANLDVTNGNAVFKNVGIGSTDPDGILDVSGVLSQASKKFILLPKVSAAGTSVLQSDSVEGGALIYNTTLRKLQFYNGNNWETVTSVEVFG